MQPIPILVFDLDGTISDPAVGIRRSINYALESFNHRPILEDEVSQYIGPPLELSFAKITGLSSELHILDLISKYRERYAEIGFSENVLYPGISEVIEELSLARIPLGLCTQKLPAFAEKILKFFGLLEHFHFISGGEVVISKAHQLKSALAATKISDRATMIGDRAIDIEAAKFNGLSSAGVLWGHGTLCELSNAKPDFLFSAPHEIYRLIKRE